MALLTYKIFDGGLGRQSGPDAPEQFPGQVKEGLEGAIVIGLGCGDCHTVALDISGKVYGWGCFRDKEGKQWFQPPKGEGAEAAKRASKLPVVIQGLPPDVAEVKCGASFSSAHFDNSPVPARMKKVQFFSFLPAPGSCRSAQTKSWLHT